MTPSEGKEFAIELLISFPGFDDAARNSPDITKTRSSWVRSWLDLELSECRAVLAQLERTGGIKYDEYREPGPFIRRLVLARRRNQPKSEAELVAEREGVVRRRKLQSEFSAGGCSLSKAIESLRLGAKMDEVLRDV